MSASTPISAEALPEGEFAIVEILGHRTLIWRMSEVERFGSKLLQIEPFFGDAMLGPVLLGGGSIYQLTPCSAEVAFKRRPTMAYQLPVSVQATLPAALLPPPSRQPSIADEGDGEPYGRESEFRPGFFEDDLP